MNCFTIALLAVVAVPTAAAAQSAHQTADGTRLAIDMPCAKSISVVTDAALSGRVMMDATAAHAEELAQMAFSGGQAAKLELKPNGLLHHGDCWRPDPSGEFEPTLQVKLSVPPGFALAVDASGDGLYHLAAGGTLDLDSSGSARIDTTALTRLNLDMSGSGRVTTTQVTGPIHADFSGSGEIAIAQVTADNVTVKQSGSSIFEIGAGRVGSLAVESTGSGQVIVRGVVGSAVVDASGSGDVTIARLTGRLAQNLSGSGAVNVEARGND